MAPLAINVVPVLRPWRGAGISHLLLEKDVAQALRQAVGAKPAITVQSKAAPPSGLRSGSPAPSPATTRAPEAVPSTAPTPPRAPRSLTPRPFTPAWQRLWDQMAASCPHPVAVWTYAELGTDLRGEANAARRSVLKELIVALRMPKGSHVFWPYSLPPGNEAEIDMFVSGLVRFRPSSVLVMGDKAIGDLSSLGTLPGGPFQDCLCRGYRFVRLPGMESIARSNSGGKSRLIAFIRTSLS